jgi:hypothetical protein
LSNKNESATVLKSENFLDLDKALGRKASGRERDYGGDKENMSKGNYISCRS